MEGKISPDAVSTLVIISTEGVGMFLLWSQERLTTFALGSQIIALSKPMLVWYI